MQFVEYEKVMYLDGDIQVFGNIDHLFDTPSGYLYAVKDCFCEISWCNTTQYKIGYCQQSPEKVTWPVETLGSPPPTYFNAGMLLFEPNLVVYEDLLRVVQITTPTYFAEQVWFYLLCFSLFDLRFHYFMLILLVIFCRIFWICISETPTSQFLPPTTLYWLCYGVTRNMLTLTKSVWSITVQMYVLICFNSIIFFLVLFLDI